MPPTVGVCLHNSGPILQMTHVIVKVINLLQDCLQSQFLQCAYVAHTLKIWSHSYYSLVKQNNWKS